MERATKTGESGKMKNRLLVFVLSALMISGCSDPPKEPDFLVEPTPRIYSVAVAVECLISGELIPEDDLKGQVWLKDGKVDLVVEFSVWSSDHARAVYGDKTLDEWADEVIASNGNWKCPFPTASPK